MSLDCISLIDGLSCFIVTPIAGEGSARIHGNLSTETWQNAHPQNLFKHADEGDISNMTEMQNPYKLPLNLEVSVFSEKSLQVTNRDFEDNR